MSDSPIRDSQGPSEPKARSWYQKKRFIIPIALIAGGVITSGLNSDRSATPEQTSSSAAIQTPAPSETEQYPGETTSQQNARESAEGYLRYSAFSRDGLIGQLEYEGYSTADAEYAVDILNVNWNEQAVQVAANYLEYSSFSRQGLIDQLLYEGFSESQAQFGVDSTGLGGESKPDSSGLTAGQQNAIESAQSYLEYSAFSKKGLIEQLEYEGYSTEDAEFALSQISVDWKEQAAKSAASYLEYSSFSRDGLIDQLLYEGFTESEAEYGVSQNGY